ncbi:MAG: MFS transporter [Deltaproteobacteria bacterium]|nr:MFS transporter [Deltaproteobacteria bacterium]
MTTKDTGRKHTPAAPIQGSASPPSEDAFPYWRRNMRSLALAAAALALGFGISNPFLPLILKEQGATGPLEIWIGYTVGGYFTLSFFLTPLWGVVADHYGRKAMVLRTSFGMGIIYLLLPLTPNLWVFLGLYLLGGTTNGFIPSTNALIATNTPINRMGRSLSMIATGALIGGTLGPVLGALVASHLPAYGHLMYVSGGLILLAGLIGLVFAQEHHQRPAQPFRLNVVEDLRIILRLPGIGMMLFFQFTTTFTYLGSIQVVSVYTLQLMEAKGVSSGPEVNWWLGMVALALTVSSAVAAPVWGRLLDRFGAERVMLAALLASSLGALPMALVSTPLQLTIMRIILGLTAAGMAPCAVTLLRGAAPRGMESRVLAWGAAFGMLGIGGGPLLAGLIGPYLGLHSFFIVNSLLLLLGFTLGFRRLKHRLAMA